MEQRLPREIERKYLILRPDHVKLSLLPRCEATQIEQTYLTDEGDFCRRVRRRGNPRDGWKYTLTRKQHVGRGERIELEEPLTPEQYSALLREADPGKRPVHKTRYAFPFRGRLLELDVYAFSEALATLEIELPDIDAPVELPGFLQVIRDVTEDARYSNYALAEALCFPEEQG